MNLTPRTVRYAHDEATADAALVAFGAARDEPTAIARHALAGACVELLRRAEHLANAMGADAYRGAYERVGAAYAVMDNPNAWPAPNPAILDPLGNLTNWLPGGTLYFAAYHYVRRVLKSATSARADLTPPTPAVLDFVALDLVGEVACNAGALDVPAGAQATMRVDGKTLLFMHRLAVELNYAIAAVSQGQRDYAPHSYGFTQAADEEAAGVDWWGIAFKTTIGVVVLANLKWAWDTFRTPQRRA